MKLNIDREDFFVDELITFLKDRNAPKRAVNQKPSNKKKKKKGRGKK